MRDTYLEMYLYAQSVSCMSVKRPSCLAQESPLGVEGEQHCVQDLKSANILLARDFTAKIADVGLARILHDDVLSTRKEVGTFAWAAPEVLLGQRVTEAADIYSVHTTSRLFGWQGIRLESFSRFKQSIVVHSGISFPSVCKNASQ